MSVVKWKQKIEKLKYHPNNPKSEGIMTEMNKTVFRLEAKIFQRVKDKP